MKFIHEDFLLPTRTARRLYHQFAGAEPILDYHCHLSPKDIAEDRRFENLFEIWLEGDHYKWRAMRSNGVAEHFCTGDADSFAKFQAWAATVPHTLRNPLYHWTHLELKRYFGIDQLLDESNAARIWNEANRQLAMPEFTAQGILKKFKVKTLCTVDDPADDLRHHQAILAGGVATRVLPTFRPDQALMVHQPESFNRWVGRLAAASGIEISGFSKFLRCLALATRLFSRAGLPTFRPRPAPLLFGFLPRKNRRRDFCQGASGETGHARGTGTIFRLHDAFLWTTGRGKGLDQAASSRSVAQQQHAAVP